MSNSKVKSSPAPVVINVGGLNPAAIYTATGKVARAAHNAERHKDLNGKTVKEILTARRLTATDIKYDVAKGFITLET